MTREASISSLVRHNEIRSFRRLSGAALAKFKPNGETAAHPSWCRTLLVREFTMKTSYILDTDWEGRIRKYAAHPVPTSASILAVGLPVIAVNPTRLRAQRSPRVMYLAPIGEDTLMVNERKCYAAHREIATLKEARSTRFENPLRHCPNKIATGPMPPLLIL